MSAINPERLDKRRQSYAKAGEDDVYNIQKTGQKPFEYGGHMKMHVLFCQPKLLYRGLKFSNED
jgi:hypothetical protein